MERKKNVEFMLCVDLLTPIYLSTWLCFAFILLPCTQHVCSAHLQQNICLKPMCFKAWRTCAWMHSYQCAEVLSWIRVQGVICPGAHWLERQWKDNSLVFLAILSTAWKSGMSLPCQTWNRGVITSQFYILSTPPTSHLSNVSQLSILYLMC